ncbi:hypothetical protein [Candidatus Chlorohelix sp.]|uniref:hypothetical protein n=1 Tax=Candidatus Chlorohelix sp. TaxID=3139201 RepID=UPI00302B40E3
MSSCSGLLQERNCPIKRFLKGRIGMHSRWVAVFGGGNIAILRSLPQTNRPYGNGFGAFERSLIGAIAPILRYNAKKQEE